MPGDCYRELRRTPLLGTWVNKGRKKGRSSEELRPLVVSGSGYLLAGQDSPSIFSPVVLKAGLSLVDGSPFETAITGCASSALL